MFISVHIAYVCILKSEYPNIMSLVLHSALHQKISKRLHNTAQVRNPPYAACINHIHDIVRLLLHCTSDDDGTSDDDVGSPDDEQAFS